MIAEVYLDRVRHGQEQQAGQTGFVFAGLYDYHAAA